MRKGENAGNHHFILFPESFSALSTINFTFFPSFILSSANAFKLAWSKNLSFGEGFTLYKKTPYFNHLPNDKFCDKTKLKGFADDKSSVHNMTNSLFDRIENTVGKGENAEHFLLFPQYFPKPSSFGSLKVGIVW